MNATIMTKTYTNTRMARPPMRGLSFWLMVFIIVFSPLPLASVPPIWMNLLTVLVGLALLSYLVQRWRQKRPFPDISRHFVLAGGLVTAVAAWAVIQATPGLIPALAHPVWGVAGATLGATDLQGTISVAPAQTLRTALAWITYVGFGLLVALHCRPNRNADLLIIIFVIAQGVYAAYGLAMQVSGLEMVLWFDKTAYLGSLTSTFINRNSYATYVGLGLLGALAILLRHMRDLVESERSTRSKILTLAEEVWGKVMIPLSILSGGSVALLMTGSRMGLAAFAVAATAFLALSVGRLRGKSRLIGIGLIGLVLAVLSANFALSGDTTVARFDRLLERGDGRFDVFALILNAIEDRPWVGQGLGTFESAFRLYRDETVVGFFDRGHSDWLELPMDVGLPAAALVILAFGVLAMTALSRSLRAAEPERPLLALCAIILVAVHATVDFSLQIPAVTLAFIALCVGGLSGSAPDRARTPRKPTKPAHHRSTRTEPDASGLRP